MDGFYFADLTANDLDLIGELTVDRNQGAAQSSRETRHPDANWNTSDKAVVPDCISSLTCAASIAGTSSAGLPTCCFYRRPSTQCDCSVAKHLLEVLKARNERARQDLERPCVPRHQSQLAS
jgi:hypothetical protein